MNKEAKNIFISFMNHILYPVVPLFRPDDIELFLDVDKEIEENTAFIYRN